MSEKNEELPGRANVSVVAKPGCDPGQIDWTISTMFVPVGSGRDEDGAICFKQDERPRSIVFMLHDRTALGLKFIEPEAEAIWIAAGTECPTAAGNGDGEFSDFRLDGQNLTVTDGNSKTAEYCYTLRFKDRDGKRHDCDPIIRNGAYP